MIHLKSSESLEDPLEDKDASRQLAKFGRLPLSGPLPPETPLPLGDILSAKCRLTTAVGENMMFPILHVRSEACLWMGGGCGRFPDALRAPFAEVGKLLAAAAAAAHATASSTVRLLLRRIDMVDRARYWLARPPGLWKSIRAARS